MVKQLIDTAIKTGRDAAKTAPKRVVQKTAYLTGNKIGDKIPSVVKSKNMIKQRVEEIYIPSEKRQKLLMT